MKRDIFFLLVENKVKEILDRNIEYSIDRIELDKKDFFVNKNGELESIDYIKVLIRAKPKIKNIEININIMRNK